MSPKPNRRLRVLMAVANNPYPRDPRVRHEAEALADAGFHVTVVAPRADGEQARSSVNGVAVLRYPLPGFGTGALSYMAEFAYVTLATAILILWVWLRKGLDVIHLHNPPDTLVLATLLPRGFGKTVIFDHHDLAPELYLAKFGSDGGARRSVHAALLRLERWSCRLAHHVITVNESYRAIDVTRSGIPEDHVTIVRNGPPLAHLNAPEPDPTLRSKAKTLVGYLGNIAKQDGVDHLLMALHELQASLGYQDWYAVIIGPADDLESLTDLVAELGISEKVWFTGYLPDTQWRRILATTDICCVPDPANPLNDKSTMMKMMEYMALGKPVVAYDLTENRATGGDAALYARPSEPLDLARQFHRLVSDPGLAEALGAEGKMRVRDGLAWEFSAAKLLGVYEGLRAARFGDDPQ